MQQTVVSRRHMKITQVPRCHFTDNTRSLSPPECVSLLSISINYDIVKSTTVVIISVTFKGNVLTVKCQTYDFKYFNQITAYYTFRSSKAKKLTRFYVFY